MIKRGNNWRGGISHSGDHKYITIYKPEHPRSSPNGTVLAHLLVAEKVIGKLLPFPIVVHHQNRIGTDNRPKNLVICENTGYHTLIHARQKALETCGHADWKKCYYCHEYDSIDNLKKSNGYYHLKCSNRVKRLKRVKTFFGYSTNKSGFRGVYESGKKYRARIFVDGKHIYLGSFIDKKNAATAYNEAAIKYYGKFARLNKEI